MLPNPLVLLVIPLTILIMNMLGAPTVHRAVSNQPAMTASTLTLGLVAISLVLTRYCVSLFEPYR